MNEEPYRHEFIRANGLRFHCLTAGEGPLVLLLHGFPQFSYAWRKQIPELAKRFRVVAPDLRGYGDSEKPPRVADYAIKRLVDDVASLVEAFGEKRASIVGHDWGGGVAWATALAQPGLVERLAVLNCPHPAIFPRALLTNLGQLRRSWYIFFFQLPWLPEWAFLRRDAELIGKVFDSASSPDIFSDAERRRYRDAALKSGAMRAALNYYRAAARDRGFPGRGRMISAPTLLIWGEEDQALGKELSGGMERYFSGAFRRVLVPGCSHWVMEERPELVNRLLLEFLTPGVPGPVEKS